MKTASKRAIQKTAEATANLIGNKIANKITGASKKPAKELHNNDEMKKDVEVTTHKKRYISPKKDNKLLMN